MESSVLGDSVLPEDGDIFGGDADGGERITIAGHTFNASCVHRILLPAWMLHCVDVR